MNKLILATAMIGLALVTSQAEAGSPMMDDPIPHIAKPYKAYRDHLGFVSSPNATRCDCGTCSAQHCHRKHSNWVRDLNVN